MKELLPIVMAVAMWGRAPLEGCNGVLQMRQHGGSCNRYSGKSKMDRAMHLMWCLSFFLAQWDVTLVCQHIPGVDNGAADALSRDSLLLFQQLVLESAAEATHIPVGLLQCLVRDTPDWTKVDWVTLFRGSI